MRVYWTAGAGLDGSYRLPAVKRVELNAKGNGTYEDSGFTLSAAAMVLAALCTAHAQAAVRRPVPVTVDNFIRAETDLYFGHRQGRRIRQVRSSPRTGSIDKQTVIRMNRDTLYSSAVFDLERVR